MVTFRSFRGQPLPLLQADLGRENLDVTRFLEDEMERKKQRKLTQREFFKICQWLENKQELLIANAPRRTVLCEMAGKDLGLDISPHSMGNCRIAK